MKFSLYNKKNQLDEMQEQTMLSIEARGFWLLWAGLLLAILVQLILGTPISQWVGEFVVFMAGCIYTMIECISFRFFGIVSPHSMIWRGKLVPSAHRIALA